MTDYNIKFDNDEISKFALQGKGRVKINFIGVEGIIPGVSIRYTIKKNKKVFQYKYRYNGEIDQFDLGVFSEEFQIEDCLKKYNDILKNAKKHNANPRDFVKLKNIVVSNDITLKTAIEKVVENSFPRKKLTGNIDKKSQKSFARFLLGHNQRYEKLIFSSNDKNWGMITLDNTIKSWGELWQTYPPGVGCDGNYKSLYDSTLAFMPIREITSYELNEYLLDLPLSQGHKNNFLKTYSHLFHFSRKKGFLGKPIPKNPVEDIDLEIPEENNSKISAYNDEVYDLDTIRAIENDCIKSAKKEPYQSEAIMMSYSCRLRPEEITKLRWDKIKKDEIGSYFDVPRYNTKGRGRSGQKNQRIDINKTLERILDRVKRQNKRRGHSKYAMLPWIFPSTVCSYEKLMNPSEHPGYAESEECRMSDVSLRNAFKRTRERLGIKTGSLKTLRKTHITHCNRILGGEHIARHYTGHKTKWVITKHYDKAKQIEVKQMSDKVSKIMFNK